MFIRVLKTLTLAVLLLACLITSGDVLRLNPAQRVSLPHQYSLARWEAGNLLSKWTHRLATTLPWSSKPAADRRSQILEYFRLGDEINRLGAEVEKAAAHTGEVGDSPLERLESELAQLIATRNKLRNDVEEVLEATVSAVLVEEGISSWGDIVFPPVDIRLSEPPKLLVTSPRDRILRTHDVLLEPDIGMQQSEEMERALEAEWDLSGLVTPLGGIMTYPASIVNTAALQRTFGIASHEWLHQYLLFRPLGRNVRRSPEMRTLNETFADVAAREIGDRAYQMLDDSPMPSSPGGDGDPEVTTQHEKDEFDFAREMRKTRLRVDELLSHGAVEEAEAYMEARRKLFVANGFNMRKLNQAYFAFHGTYAESPASVSPIGEQLHRFRDLMPDLETFVETMSDVSSYHQFLDTLEQLEAKSSR